MKKRYLVTLTEQERDTLLLFLENVSPNSQTIELLARRGGGIGQMAHIRQKINSGTEQVEDEPRCNQD